MHESSSGSGFLLRNWRVRFRLVALILVPTLAALMFGGLSVASSVATAGDYERVNELAQLVDKVGVLTHELQTERDRAAWNATLGRPAKGTTAVLTQIGVVDKASTEVRGLATELRSSIGGRAGTEIENIIGRIDSIEPLRQQAVRGTLLPNAVIVQYSLVIDDLLTLQDQLATGSHADELVGMAVTMSALAKAKENASIQRGLLSTVLPVGRFEQNQLRDFLGALSQQESELKIFRKNATSAERDYFDSTVSGSKVDQAQFLRTLVLDRASAGFSLKDLDLTTRDDTREWFDAMSEPIDRMRTVEGKLASSIVTRSQALKDDEQQRAIIVASAVGVVLLAVLLITIGVARSLVRPLRRLRTEALEIAGHRLPDTVQRLREAGDAGQSPAIVPIGVFSRDEVGEVARAFDEVHREAIRLAGDEARLRSNVNAIFVNLSRRSQTLVERQLSLIEGLEQGEQDDQRLGNLFKLDHLATRMRRNSENLLVLAGQEPARRWGQPIPIIDVVRASLSEVESYERVNIQVSPGTAVVGQAVNDVVHLVAELVENAISFSPRETKVTVSSNRIDGGGLMISVSDVGIGMTSDELAQTNWRLANPPVVDVSVSRRMGLFVVGRLALRHGIRVQLRQQDTGGLTAMVLLPEALLSQPNAFPAVPGMPQPEVTGPAQQFGAPSFGMPALASPTSFEPMPRTPVFGADAPGVGAPQRDPFDRGPFETFDSNSFGGPPAQRNPFDPGPAPANPFGTGPLPRDPFDSGRLPGNPFDSQPVDRNPFDSGPLPGNPFDSQPVDRNPFASGPPQRNPFDPAPKQGNALGSAAPPGSPFEIDPFDAAFDPRPFDTGHFGEAPIDTPWPGQLPPPGSTAWPGPELESGGWALPGRGQFDSDIDNTGPLPAVRTSPLEAEEEFLPIFAAVESDWFRRVDLGETPESNTETTPPQAKAWSSPADAGWQAAQAASEPALGGVTSSGLPKRVPKANLVPGSAESTMPKRVPKASLASGAADSTPTPAAAPAPPVPVSALSPERVRSRLSSFQQGVRQARAVARGDVSEDQGYPGAKPVGGDFTAGLPRTDPESEKEDS